MARNPVKFQFDSKRFFDVTDDTFFTRGGGKIPTVFLVSNLTSFFSIKSEKSENPKHKFLFLKNGLYKKSFVLKIHFFHFFGVEPLIVQRKTKIKNFRVSPQIRGTRQGKTPDFCPYTHQRVKNPPQYKSNVFF